MVKEIFQERYLFEKGYLDDIIPVNSILELYEIKSARTLILDVHTFERVHRFLRNNILCYSNLSNGRLRSSTKEVTYYGFYPYQAYDKRALLKFHFSIYKPIEKPPQGRVLISSSKTRYEDIKLPGELKNREKLYKDKNRHHTEMFEQFETLYYFNSELDTNNRLIPECFFYGKEVILESNGNYGDSTFFRYSDILKNGLGSYVLDHSDIMVCDFLAN